MISSPAKQLGLIGFGAFGRLAAEHLRDHFEVIAADRADHSAEAAALGVGWATPEEAAARPYVLLALPIQSFRPLLETIRDHLRPGALVIDVGSVKVAPLAAMQAVLSEHVEIVGTHPMFGPQSAAGGLAGHRIVVCPLRTTRLDAIRDFLTGRLGLDVHVCDAETHDRQIARTQALAQFVGRALAKLEESDSPVRTPGYDQLRDVAETVGADSWELFTAIQNLNPYAAEMRAELLRHLDELQRRLGSEAETEALQRRGGAEAETEAPQRRRGAEAETEAAQSTGGAAPEPPGPDGA